MKKQTGSLLEMPSVTTTVVTELRTENVPLQQLMEWTGNVRTIEPSAAVESMAESIASQGLIQSLAVKPGRKKDTFDVLAGNRRLKALRVLLEQGRLQPDYPVPCRIFPANCSAKEISLAENVHRVSLHPADEFEAFNDLANAGITTADIAERFGVPEKRVLQRLVLARVNPKFLAMYKAGEITLDHVQAFTLTSDHARQEQVWDALPEYNRSARYIRQHLLDADVPASDKRVRFVGLAAYETAGGTCNRDLFLDEEDGTIVCDVALLDKLVAEKLEAEAAALKAAGWKWVTIGEQDYRLSRLEKVQRELSEDLAKEQAALETRFSEIESQLADLDETRQTIDEDDSDPEYADLNTERQTVESRLEELDDLANGYTAEQRAIRGVSVVLHHSGELKIRYGLQTKDDLKAAVVSAPRPHGSPADPVPVKPTEVAGYSSALVEELTQTRTAALSVELFANRSVALRSVVHSMLLSVFRDNLYGSAEDSCLDVRTIEPQLGLVEDSKASKTLSERKTQVFRLMQAGMKDCGSIWLWLEAAPESDLMDLLAFAAGMTINAVSPKAGISNGRLQHADSLAVALGMDMTGWYQPTATGLFSRLTKAQILAALTESGVQFDPEAPKWKKGILAEYAGGLLADSGWLPALLRMEPVNYRYDAGPLSDGEDDEDEDDPAEPEDEEDDEDFSEVE
jgi:ParB family chromosome partitioning protein